jgi:hypothetical protein
LKWEDWRPLDAKHAKARHGRDSRRSSSSAARAAGSRTPGANTTWEPPSRQGDFGR